MAKPCRGGNNMAADGGMATGSSKHMPQAAEETVGLALAKGMIAITTHMPEEMVGIAKVMLYTLPSALALAWIWA